MDIDKKTTAVLITDPQNDFLSEQGATWQALADPVFAHPTYGEAIMTLAGRFAA